MKRFWHWLHSKRLSPVTWEETNVSVLWFLKSQVHTNVRGHLCASERAAATRRCAWNASRRKPSCRQTAARRCAIGREPGAEMFSWMSFHSREHGRCVSSSPPPQVCRGNTQISTVKCELTFITFEERKLDLSLVCWFFINLNQTQLNNFVKEKNNYSKCRWVEMTY